MLNQCFISIERTPNCRIHRVDIQIGDFTVGHSSREQVGYVNGENPKLRHCDLGAMKTAWSETSGVSGLNHLLV